MNSPRAFHSAAVLADSRVLVVGGTTANGEFLSTVELDGTIIGRFGGADHPLGAFGTLHLIDCRNDRKIIASSFPDWVQTIKVQP